MTGFAALPIAEEEDDSYNDTTRWIGMPKITGPRWAHLPTLTVGLLGVQVLWSVEMSYASPYLLSLGLSKSWMAMVFLAGPLSGLIVQPLIGILADHSKSRFGRRRPYMIAGSVLCGAALLLLGFTRPVATIFTTLNSSANDILTIWLAVFAIYCIDFSINAVQAVDRALLVDTLPPFDQPSGNAWAARMLAIGSVAGFFVGNVDLPRIFPIFGKVQLEVLSVIACLLLLFTHSLTSFFVKERVLVTSPASGKGLRQEIRAIWAALFRLPRIIRQICIIQFFAWLAWFPVLFYTTVYIGELHKRSSPIPVDDEAELILDAEATRLGSRALFYSALVSLAVNTIMPVFVTRTSETTSLSPVTPRKSWLEYIQIHLASLWALSHLLFALCMAATFFTSSVGGATFIMALTGFSWAITQWAPFSLLAEAILSHPTNDDAASIHLADTRSNSRGRTSDGESDDEETRSLVGGSDRENGHDTFSRSPTPGQLQPGHARVMGNPIARVSRIDVEYTDIADHDTASLNRKTRNGLSSQAGVILGIHNMFIVVPQFLVTGLSSIIFAIFDPEKSVLHGHHPGNTKPTNGTLPAAGSAEIASRHVFGRQADILAANDGPNSIAIIFRLGGVAAAVAFVLCWRLARELKRI
ncbi:major facilitator superfamily domain-containing protein [Hygrophoropsis aurantiaca]|uniref:Major facilitator superfamily domain-containing protein n=1 Tax=Hygrophoropsis aurantiaca TaxID=72124 RepID=A0ACB8ASI6_9AGAM|nr:major facilitator superfamily domain-containing protein [Hygrophoropsis aurantiaca]